MSVATDLTELHRLHTALKEVRDELARGPRQLKVRDQVITNAKNEVVSKQEELKQTRMSADRKGLELKSLESKLVDLKGKLNQASSNREYDILRGQIEADTAAKAVMEDEILDHLDRLIACRRKSSSPRTRSSRRKQTRSNTPRNSPPRSQF